MSLAVYLDSVSGVAGDMFAASFVDARVVAASELEGLPSLLGLAGVEIKVSTVLRANVQATHIRVVSGREGACEPGSPGAEEIHLPLPIEGFAGGHVSLGDIRRLLAGAKLDEPVRRLAGRIFELLAQAEGASHGYAADQVAFHEIGSIDSILDVVMASYCVNRLGACRRYASPVRPGRGFVRMAHGTFPIPPPASLRLLEGMPVAPTPSAVLRENVELSTPTGIAILKALEPQFVKELPPGTVQTHGLGAGTMDLGALPNVFRIVLFDEAQAPVPEGPYDRDQVVEITCNVDDDTGEHLAWMVAKLLERGALDAWLTPLTGKKGRPAICLSVLATQEDWVATADWIMVNGTTFGLRYRPWDRLKLIPQFESRETPRGPVTYKLGATKDGRILKEKPEFEDVKASWENPRG